MKTLLLFSLTLIVSTHLFSQEFLGIVSDSCESYNSVYTYDFYSNGHPSSGYTYLIFQDDILIGQGGGGLGCCIPLGINPLTDNVIFTTLNNQGMQYYIRTLNSGNNWSTFDNVGLVNYPTTRFFSENTGYVLRNNNNDQIRIERISDIQSRSIFCQVTYDTLDPHLYITDTIFGNPYCPDINEIVYKFRGSVADTFYVHIVFDVIITDINKIDDKSDINIFPNPSNSLLTVDIKNDCSIEIIDIFGKVILNQNLLKGQNKLNIENFAPNYYFIRIKTKHRIINRAFIKL